MRAVCVACLAWALSSGCGGRTENDPIYWSNSGTFGIAGRNAAGQGGSAGHGGATSNGGAPGTGGAMGRGGAASTGGVAAQGGSRPGTGGVGSGGLGGGQGTDACLSMCAGMTRACSQVEDWDELSCRRECLNQYAAAGPTCQPKRLEAMACLNRVLARPNAVCEDLAVAIAFGCSSAIEAADECNSRRE
ncbi:MAG TPA: hypothetical protein VFQ61_11845 [Polyangiaceae bacterium]|nr:hypothetical protein [Polyangiaceae bacterium]